VSIEGGTAEVTSNSGEITITGEAANAEDIDIDAPITSTSGDITLIADDIHVGDNIASSGALLIAPRTASTSIGIGGGSGNLNLTGIEIGFLQDGFSSITIGDAATGTGAVDVDSSTFLDDVTIVGGNIAVTELALGSDATAVTLTARTGAITDGGDTGTDVIGSNVFLNAGGDIAASGDELSLAADTVDTNSTLNSANGDQFLAETDSVTINGFDAGSGTVNLVTNGEFDLTTDAVTAGTSVVVDDGTTLDVNGAANTVSFASVTVKDGGTLTGDGDLGSNTPVTVEDGGVSTLGTGGTGTNTGAVSTGDLTLHEGSEFTVTIDGTAGPGAPNGHDQFNVRGMVTLDNPTLLLEELPASYTPTAGDTFTIIENDGSGDLNTGTFIGLTEGTYISSPSASLPDQLFQISYIGDDGNDVILTASGVTATTNITIDGAGNLVIEDILGSTDTADNLSIEKVGTDYVIEDLDGNALGTLIVGATQTDVDRVVVPMSLLGANGGIIVNTLGGDDTVTIGDLGTLNTDGNLDIDGGLGQDGIVQTGDAVLTGTGAVDYDAETIFMQGGSSLTTDSGDIDITGTGATGNAVGVRLRGADIGSTSGDIDMDGHGGDSGFYNRGILLDIDLPTATASTIETGGSIDLDGTGGDGSLFNTGVEVIGGTVRSTGAGPVTIDGTGGDGTMFNNGVAMFKGATVDAGTGNLDINGTAGSTGTFSRGVNLGGAITLESDGGNITVNGTGGGATTGLYGAGTELVATDITTNGNGTITLRGTGNDGSTGNYGLKLSQSTATTADGAVLLEGTGNGTGLLNHGVQVLAGSELEATGTGTVTVRGTASADGSLLNHGVEVASASRLEVANGDLTVEGTGGGKTSMGKGLALANSFFTSSGSGDINLSGTGSTDTTTGLSSGIEGTRVTIETTGTSTGNITLSGSGGSGNLLNSGVRLASASVVRTVGSTMAGEGDITILGTGGGSGSMSSGVQFAASSSAAAGGSGALTITGTGADGLNSNEGIQIASASSLSTVCMSFFETIDWPTLRSVSIWRAVIRICLMTQSCCTARVASRVRRRSSKTSSSEKVFGWSLSRLTTPMT